MKTRDFLNQLEHDALVAAIRDAERKTSGEIRVFISHKQTGDALAAAQTEFDRLGMARTQERNGVLLYVAPRVRKFAIIGDAGIHAKCGDDFWQQVADEMSSRFRAGEFTAGITHAIGKAGELLAQHFPRTDGDRNELSDDIAHD
ncbi:MAG: TPM domain-containing protein [Verrucomicrobia bacterium]|nr:TPM domain-containing protein [Verrucomicrobiota bacterium]